MLIVVRIVRSFLWTFFCRKKAERDKKEKKMLQQPYGTLQRWAMLSFFASSPNVPKKHTKAILPKNSRVQKKVDVM